jgi:hypothetical protein
LAKVTVLNLPLLGSTNANSGQLINASVLSTAPANNANLAANVLNGNTVLNVSTKPLSTTGATGALGGLLGSGTGSLPVVGGVLGGSTGSLPVVGGVLTPVVTTATTLTSGLTGGLTGGTASGVTAPVTGLVSGVVNTVLPGSTGTGLLGILHK